MKILIVVSCVFGVALARAAAPLVALPIAYAKLEAGAPIGLDGKVIDTPEVAYAKAEHAAAHINERLNHAAIASSSEAVVIEPAIAKLQLAGGAPIGLDGRVVDTPEVALAKAEHAAAHLNEKLRSAPIVAAPLAAPAAPVIAARAAPIIAAPAVASTIISPAPVLAKAQPGAPIGLDGRVIDTPEVAYAKAEHAAAKINARLENAAEDFKNLAASNYIYYASPYVQYYI